MVFGVFDFLQKTNEKIRLYYYDTSSRLVFVRFLEEIEDTKKPFRNYLTFKKILKKLKKIRWKPHNCKNFKLDLVSCIPICNSGVLTVESMPNSRSIGAALWAQVMLICLEMKCAKT